MNSSEPRIPYEADAAMRRGEKLQAVKITREKLGLSLKDAKERCDAWSPNDPAPPASDPANAPGDPAPGDPAPGDPAPAAALPPGGLPAAAVDALSRGNRIEAIKAYREATGEGLKESKEAVETWEAAHPELAPAASRDAASCDSHGCERRGCAAGRLLLALLALGLIAAAVYFSGVLG